MNSNISTSKQLVIDYPPVRPRAKRVHAAVLIAIMLGYFVTVAASLVRAAPGDFEVEVFADRNYTGASKIVGMDPKLSQQWVRIPSTMSVKVGKKVGMLVQVEITVKPGGVMNYFLIMEDRDFLNPYVFEHATAATPVLLFNKGVSKGKLPNGKPDWERPHPDGVTVAENSSNTLVGGVNPEVMRHYFSPDEQYLPDHLWLIDGFLRVEGDKFHWFQIWGKDTVLTIRDHAGHTKSYTTNGQAWAEYNLEGSTIFQNLAGAEVTLAGAQTTPAPPPTSPSATDPLAARSRWEYQAIRFQQFSFNKWVEFQSGKAMFAFDEVARKPEFVELRDPLRKAHVRLYNDHNTLLKPGYNSQFQLLYQGGGWRDGRYYWTVAPGRYFKNTSGKQWVEFQNDQPTFQFSESKRTNELVELYDAQRGLWIQLKADLALIKRQDDSSQQWKPLGSGKWGFEDAPQIQHDKPSPTTPAIPMAVDLSGSWVSNFAVVYQIQQQATNFTWTAAALNQQAKGKLLSASEVTATWAKGPQGTAKGKLTQFDPAGKPKRIEWSNGVVFTRQ